jgi:diacylglycerol kinase family enzyme
MKITLILNRDAGTLRALDAKAVSEELAGIFRAEGHNAMPVVTTGEDVVAAIRQAAKAEETDAIVVGGGDGTISCAAAISAMSGVPLGILPLGTMNYFARSLGIPAEMKAAAVALATGEFAAVDIAEVNGHPFVHTLILGLHPKMVEERERAGHHTRYGKMLGSARAFMRVLRNPRRFFVSIETDGKTVVRRTAGVVVSNNPLGKGHMPYADRLDRGVLGLYVTTARGLVQLVRVTAAAALGTAEESPLIDYLETTTADINLGGQRSIRVTLDGELVRLRVPLKVKIVAGGLRVLKPRTEPPARSTKCSAG